MGQLDNLIIQIPDKTWDVIGMSDGVSFSLTGKLVILDEFENTITNKDNIKESEPFFKIDCDKINFIPGEYTFNFKVGNITFGLNESIF